MFSSNLAEVYDLPNQIILCKAVKAKNHFFLKERIRSTIFHLAGGKTIMNCFRNDFVDKLYTIFDKPFVKEIVYTHIFYLFLFCRPLYVFSYTKDEFLYRKNCTQQRITAVHSKSADTYHMGVQGQGHVASPLGIFFGEWARSPLAFDISCQMRK